MTRRSSPARRPPKPGRTEAHSPHPAPTFRWPTLAELLDPKGPFLIPAALLVAGRVALSLYLPFAAEDAYITFRYARNFASGFGLVFNPGEHVFGFSSPLWTVWMAAGFKLGAPPVMWARVSTLASELAALVVVAGMLKQQISNRSAWCFAFFWAVWPYFGAVSVSGMENQAMVGLIALAAAFSARRSPMAGPSLGAVALMRPEGVVAAAILGWLASWRCRLVGFGVAAAGIVALALYFGSPIPQSLIAKSQIYGTPGPWAGRHWWEWLSPFVFGRFPQVSDTGHLFLLSIVFAPAAWFGARTLWAQRSTPLAGFIGACAAIWLGYAVLGVAYFWWYLAVPLAGLSALAAVGFPRLTRGPALEISVAAVAVGLWTVTPRLYLGRAQSEYLGFAGAANYLAQHAQMGQKVMLEPIGMVGFQAPLVVVDEVGLVSPQVSRRRLQGPGWYTDVVSRERPDWLVVRRAFLSAGESFAGAGAAFRNAGERDSLLARYAVATAVDTVSGPGTLVIMSRRR